MKILGRTRWARGRSTFARIFARLQTHKASLSLILAILQSQNNAQAEQDLGKLYVLVDKILNTQKDIALHIAAERGHARLFRLLLDNRAKTSAVTKPNGWAPLHLVAKNR